LIYTLSRGGIAALLVDAVVLVGPLEDGLLGFDVVVARRGQVEMGVPRQLQHDRSHHLVVLVWKNVAMVDETRVFPQLISWNMEIGACLRISYSKVGLSPSDSVLENFMLFDISCIFPASVIVFGRWSTFICNIFVL
jgi:hypothetical protein